MPTVAINNKNSVKDRFSTFDLSNLSVIVSNARKGVKAKIFYDFAETIKIPEKKLAAIINLSARTISNYSQELKSAGADIQRTLVEAYQLADTI